MAVLTRSDLHAWWADLRHHGMVLAPALLEEYFPDGPVAPGSYEYQRLRERYTVFETWYQQGRVFEQGVDAGSHRPLYTWLDGVLDIFLGHPASRWQKGSNVDPRWRHETFARDRLAPHRVLFQENNPHDPALFVWIEQTPQLAQGHGRTAYGKLLELLRAKNVRLGLLTNGRQFRLCYAGLDYDSWVEWDVENWFAEEEFRRQLHGFYTLLGPQGINPRGEMRFPLQEAADASRTRQSDLSFVLGEQVRESVELLLNEMNQAVHSKPALLDMVSHTPEGNELSERRLLEALYQATVRIIMRLVIILFAEARDLLPRSLASYNTSYGLEGLFEQLSRAHRHEGEKAMDERYSAWSRLLSLCSLIYYGSPLPTLPVHAYGGMLFRPGEEGSSDSILRAMALFESSDLHISDAIVLRLLRLLKIGKVKVKQGRGSRWVNGPVDFSELRTEYIGLMYQGLLDFNLHRASQPMLFLNLGQEPVLPLHRLEVMNDTELKELLKKLSIEKSGSPVSLDEEEGEGAEESEETVDEGENAEEIDDEPVADGAELDDLSEDESSESDNDNEPDDVATETEAELLYRRALEWAKRAVDVGGLLPRPKGKRATKDDTNEYLYEKARTEKAVKLLRRVLDTQEFYLVRRGGTRKGSGTFYTKPQLAVPIARHTLEPLLYTQQDAVENAEEAKDNGANMPVPRTPEEVLNIKVCDPACGSASFLVAALHYMTDALYSSLLYHRGITSDATQTRLTFYGPPVTLPFGTPSRARPEEELLPIANNAIDREPRIKARLRRYVVERCIYGVDLSPLAVELARMSLWIETMDKDMPFTFLDHKIKIGNALVGAWFDTFREYPIMAWLREGGDDSHTNGVHYQKGAWTRSIKETRNDIIKPELIAQIQSSLPQLFPEYIQETPEGLHNEYTHQMEQLHTLPIESAQEREERYRMMQQSPGYQELKQACDRWCAAWFWPADELSDAPTPGSFYHPTDRTRAIIRELTEDLHFFHWEIEFPDVFARPEHGFDAILANPPWETAKPYSKEFFSDYDPLYRTYGKQEALQQQHHLFELDDEIEREWLRYQSYFKGMSNWAKRAASPFGDPVQSPDEVFTIKTGRQGTELHKLWRARRAHYPHLADVQEPFQYQGSADLNTYKMFLEVSHHLLRDSGYIGMLVPSSIYTDQGSSSLRKLFLDDCNWQWLFGFINRRRIFAIHSAFKFVVLLIEKGAQTEQMHVAFNQESLDQLLQPEQVMQPFARQQVERFSPHSLSIIEVQSPRDTAILEKLYTRTVLLGYQGAQSWQIKYATEFHSTNDSKLFPPLPIWENRGYRPDRYERWIDTEGSVALPLYEGRMVGNFDPSRKGWISGKGRGAIWKYIAFDNKTIKPQYLLSIDDYMAQKSVLRGGKISFMRIGSSTNVRSMYASLVGEIPCSDTASVIQPEKHNIVNLLSLLACLNALSYDYAVRCRLGGMHLDYFLVAETPLIPPARIRSTICAQLAGRLNLIMPSFAPQWLELRAAYPALAGQHWRKLWAITEHERLRLRCILDAIIAELYGLDYDDFAWIVRPDRDNPKGFWRVDKEKPEALRHTTLALAAFAHLKEVGFEAFCAEDWQFPAEIAAQLGPRFTEWQEQGTIEKSWAECEYHAQRMKEIVIPLAVQEQSEFADEQRIDSNGHKRGRRGRQTQVAQESQMDLWSDVRE